MEKKIKKIHIVLFALIIFIAMFGESLAEKFLF